jgi:hypothetical protein
LNKYDRPEITFRYHRDQGGVVEDDSAGIRHVAWDEYLDREGRSEILGQTYPGDIEAWNRRVGEGGRVVDGSVETESEDEEIKAIFGSSS